METKFNPTRYTLLFILWFLVLRLGYVKADCVTYGLCHKTNDLYQQCIYNGPPKQLTNSTGLEILKTYCPSLFNGTENTYTCCDTDQLLLGLKNEIQSMAAVVRRCPSCEENLITLTCHSTCDPNESDHVVLRKAEVNEETEKRYVTELDLYISSYFTRGAFDSCAHVAIPSLGKSVLDATCGRYTAAQCTPERWFHFLGDATVNPQAPINVNFKIRDKPFLYYTPMNLTVYKCNENPKNSSSACSCVDCLESCPATPNYSVINNYSFEIIGFDGVGIIVILIFTTGSTIFLVTKIRNTLKKADRNTPSSSISISSIDDDYKASFINNLSDKTEAFLEKAFFNCGKAVAQYPTLVLALCSWAVGICTYGILQLQMTYDPVQIWAAPNSQSRLEKTYYESRFGPFYRTQQIYFKPINQPKIQHNTSSGMIEFGPAFNYDFLLAVFDLQEKIYAIPGLQKLCFAPLSTSKTAQSLSQCTVMSVWGYFGNDVNKFKSNSTDADGYVINYLDTIYSCLQSSTSTDCLAPYGGIVEPALAVGGFLQYGDEAYEKANAIVLTFLLNNHISGELLDSAVRWEKEFIKVVKNWTKTGMPDFVDIAFNSEMSIQEAIQEESNTEIFTVMLSYLIMFLYVSLTLGSYKSIKYLLLRSKILLGMGGIFLVLVSITSSVGIFGYMEVPTSLLTIEVVPFLLLAVGVDNMFLLVNALTRNELKYKDPIQCIAKSVAEVGPSILLTTLSEAACFGIGALNDMPAVKTFSLYAFTAILINFLLQITAFTAFMTLHIKRIRSNRLDIFTCIKVRNAPNEKQEGLTFFQKLIKKYIVPVIFQPVVNSIMILLFFGLFFMSLAFVPHIEPGLDQKLAVSKDSDVYKYFEFMEEILSIGPPVYFVLKPGLNFTHEEHQNLICGTLKCNYDSLNTQIYIASKDRNVTRIRTSPSSWLDDYFDWSTVDNCCKMYENGTFCPHTNNECIRCNISTNEDGMRPTADSFRKYLQFYLEDNPDVACAKSGHAAYSNALNYELDLDGSPVIKDSYFMAYHTTLKTSKDFYSALYYARNIAQNITVMLNREAEGGNKVEVFPYSVFYVFYEQYLTIWTTLLTSLLYSLIAVFIVTYLLMSFDFKSSLIILLTVFMIVTDLAGLMYWWSIDLNAITLVNLVVAVGISVEFCSHIVHSFAISSKIGRKLRAQDALITTGSSVFAGITLTKFIGISVLAFSKAQAFQVFYFRMYLGMVLFGGTHGLVFLPILLSYIGPENKEKSILRKRREIRVQSTEI